jgi:hypothetical protein
MNYISAPQIQNPELKELDAKVADFHKLSARYFNSLPNLHGRQIYGAKLSELLNEIDKIKPDGKFDELVLRNIESNLRLNDVVIDYLVNPTCSLSVREFIDTAAGEGTFDYLEDKVKSAPWKERWENLEKTQERSFRKVSPFTEEAQQAAKEWKHRIEEDIISYGKKEGYLPEDFQMSVLLLPPKEGSEYSSWNSQTNVFSLGSYTFEFLHDGGKVVALPTKAYNIAFHEVFGHGGHQIFSKQLPLSLRFTEEVGAITPTKSITEGVAINRERQGYKFLRKRLNEIGLTEDDVNLLEEEDMLEGQTRLEYMYYALLKDRELKEKGFDSYEHLLGLTQNPVIARKVKHDFKAGFEDIWGSFGHTFGPLHYQAMLDQIKDELEENPTGEELRRLHQATSTGVWSWEIYPEAVKYFLKNPQGEKKDA